MSITFKNKLASYSINIDYNIVDYCYYFYPNFTELGYKIIDILSTGSPYLSVPKSIMFKNGLCNVNIVDLFKLDTCYIWQFIPKVCTDMHINYMFSGSYLLYLWGLFLMYLIQPYIIVIIDKTFNKVSIIKSISSRLYFHDYSFSHLKYVITPIFALIKPVQGELHFHGLSMSHFNRYCASLLLLFYILLGTLFDFFMHRIYVRSNLGLNFFTYTMCGFFYSFSILIGIFFTNSLWILMHDNLLSNLAAGIGFILPTVLFSGVWFFLRTSSAIISNDLLNSFFRQITDTVAFICICINTYGSWNLYVQSINNSLLSYYIAIPLGLLIHLISGYFLIGLELNNGNFMYYGVLYLIWWTAAIFNTNSIIAWFSYILPYPQYMNTWVSVILIAFISVVVNYPQYFLYAVNNSLNNSRRIIVNRVIDFLTRNRHVIVFRLYITILAYCIYGGLLWSILMYYFI